MSDQPEKHPGVPSERGRMHAEAPSTFTPDAPLDMRRDVPESAGMCRPKPDRQNEPTATAPEVRPGQLSLRQHAAIRHLARGYGSVAIARHLGVNHHTIGRWKRDPMFAAELERLRREMTDAAIAAPGHRAPPTSAQRSPMRRLDVCSGTPGEGEPSGRSPAGDRCRSSKNSRSDGAASRA